MARGIRTDFLHSMRFHVVVTGGTDVNQDIDLDTDSGEATAGFSAVTTPEATVEAVEYKEGTMVYTRKYPGNPSMSDITLSRGVARGYGTFWRWLRLIIEGGPIGATANEYRADLDIKHFHREVALIRTAPTDGTTVNKTGIAVDQPTRTYHVREAFAIRHKVSGDLDATASEISIMELDLSYEHFEVEEHGIPTAAG